MANTEQAERFYNDLTRQSIPDIEAHCRTIHAMAVCHSFSLCFRTPLRCLQSVVRGLRKSLPDQQHLRS